MSRRSPFRSVWFNPSQTIARIAHENPGYRQFALPIFAGFAVWPTVALFSTDDSSFETGLVLSTLLAFGPVAEILQLFVGAYLIRLTGIWLGGKAGTASIQAAIVWGNVPIVVLAILGFVLAGFSSFYSDFAAEPLTIDQSPFVFAIAIFFLLLQFVIVLWSFGIFLRGLATVQGFSTSRALINALVAWSLPAAIVISVAIGLGYSDKVLWLFFAGIEDLVFSGAR